MGGRSVGLSPDAAALVALAAVALLAVVGPLAGGVWWSRWRR